VQTVIVWFAKWWRVLVLLAGVLVVCGGVLALMYFDMKRTMPR
jgi:formate hydrogenlyase subunit 3/multisubunit Na+/H+ antiporter MnhD subunit